MFTIISISILFLSFLLFRRVAGSMKLTQLNMITWVFYFQLIVSSFIPSVLIINGWANDVNYITFVGENTKLYGWLSVQYVMISMPLGMIFINYLHGCKSNRDLFCAYVNAPILASMNSKQDSFIKYPLYFLSLISLLSIIYVFRVLESITIISIFKDLDARALLVIRQEFSRGFEGSTIIKNFFALSLAPILTYVAYGYWCLSKTKINMLWFVSMLISSFFIITYDLSKGPFIEFLLGFVFMTVLIKGYIKKRTLVIFAIMALLLLGIIYIYISRLDDVRLIYNAVINRIFLGQAVGTYLALEYFPNAQDYIGFSSMSKLFCSVFGTDFSERSARIIMQIQNPSGIIAGQAGVINSLFIAEAWANYGLYGIIISPLYVGMFVQIVYMYFLKSRKTPIMIALCAFISYKLPITGGFNDFLYFEYFAKIFLVFMFVYIMGLVLKNLKQR